MVGVCGVGTDLVHVPTFASQLALPGSEFATPGRVFTARELRRANTRAAERGDTAAVHLAAVWAMKEAALKAWSSALDSRGLPPPLARDGIAWAEFTVTHSPTGAPHLTLGGRSGQALQEDLGEGASWQVSASHDGDYATAIALLISG